MIKNSSKQRKRCLTINKDYKKIENTYEIQDKVALITLLKKNGTPLITKIDAEDLEKVQKIGTWFVEWHKDFNNYLVQNISPITENGKTIPVKRNLQSIIMDINSKAPIRHINGDTLDNRKSNLEVFERNAKNDYEIIDENTIALILKDKYGNPQAKALISKEDLDYVVTSEYSWVFYKSKGEPCVIANTPNGRIRLDRLLMKPDEKMTVHHINLNPLDNRRYNLENKLI
jgi:hypothetical protein